MQIDHISKMGTSYQKRLSVEMPFLVTIMTVPPVELGRSNLCWYVDSRNCASPHRLQLQR